MTARTQGYLFVCITMCIWGGFTILSRLNLHWHVSAWDLVAMRFAIAFIILMPVLVYKKDLAFLWHPRPIILALSGGLAYCLTVYTAFLHAPAAHAAIFLNGCIPLCTAVAAYLLFKQPFDKHTWFSLIIMLSALALMSYLMLHEQASAFGLGDILFFLSAVWWGIFTVLLKQWKLSAWHSMASVAIWSALIYLPIYILFIPKHFQEAEPVHLLIQGVFHGVLVVIIATLTYVAAIERLGAFKTGSIVTLAPFIAAVIAVPLLNEPLSPAIMCGLVGMGIGALQPWRWFRKDALTAQLSQQKQD
ncbi:MULTISPECIES: DMT family transporter [unclassified Acinetobacter]|uniref:DMT family transporter n=1 Tax=unclassified Acinetobacter TaxID=196816 RepID=UPI00244C605D|nr:MULTISPECIES: DMT family transporter [unclassified Acinetobacter]MDH0032770.1 DMT family transporter [Acinetobacter sp. GD04021]MDH0888198.1 DMT family transporter [Acinetobacter sp. GD03873]MDH1084549.1 DMT family transporter [Acinetobacter sp. GD03983]MDH2189422.1 DMT family transporter [Acinetobacter sp. GD03645]MDH2205106.1 DMT family transporter [Acinetobacter sp. GD03647]